MNISEDGLNLIKKSEGYRDTAYPDPATGGEPWTIGYGHTRGVKEGDTCTEEQATEWLKEDVYFAEKCIKQSVKVDITQGQYDALVSFIYNVGCGNFRNSTLLRKLNEGDDVGAADEFIHWSKANGKTMKGLLTRREAERDLFLA